MKVKMFKLKFISELVAPKEEVYGIYDCLSNNQAILVCEQIKNKYGLIGRYYCETSSGFQFQV